MVKAFSMILIVIVVLPFSAMGAVPISECGHIEKPISGAYCIFKAPKSKSQNVIHYFHGSGGNERSWVNSGSLFRADKLRDIWEANGIDAPVVVAVSFGPSWSLVEANSGINSEYLQKYVDSILPMVESRVGFIVRERILLGMSMGGGNAAQLFLKYPKLFTKAALISPAIVDMAPSDVDFINHMVDENHANVNFAMRFKQNMVLKIPDLQSWLLFSPLDLGDRLLSPDSPELLVEIGTRD
ncbi:MAG: alpha/beta hydrolase-fold protein [Pseudobdellovibrionaceae bacterium]